MKVVVVIVTAVQHCAHVNTLGMLEVEFLQEPGEMPEEISGIVRSGKINLPRTFGRGKL
jgi:hypothetical protein